MNEEIKESLNALEPLIKSRQKWKSLTESPEWEVFFLSVRQARLVALENMANADDNKQSHHKAVFLALNTIKDLITRNTDFTDLDDYLTRKTELSLNLREIEEDEQRMREPVYTGGAI